MKGIDISEYAIAHTIDTMKAHVQVANAKELPFPDKSFDVAIPINTIHNLDKDDCAVALREIESQPKAFITAMLIEQKKKKPECLLGI